MPLSSALSIPKQYYLCLYSYSSFSCCSFNCITNPQYCLYLALTSHLQANKDYNNLRYKSLNKKKKKKKKKNKKNKKKKKEKEKEKKMQNKNKRKQQSRILHI